MDLRGTEVRANTMEPMETRKCLKDITGQTFNTLIDCCQVLRIFSNALEGDADTPRNEPEVKCFRDVLISNLELSNYILNKLNEIVEDFGV